MKMTYKILFASLITVVAIGGCKKKGCTDSDATNYNSEAKKDDQSCTYIPTITLNGAASVSVDLNAAYTDEGATATNRDGSSVSVTSNAADVNTAVTGSYTITYTATNDYGSVTTSRTVTVVIPQDYWFTSTWAITHDCGTTTFPLATPPTISAGSTSSDLVFDSFFTLVGGTANATVSGSAITFPNQTITITGGEVIFSGSGTMNSSGTEITVNYTYDNTVPLIGGTGSCTAIYTKQ